jgi:hypothetical protein
MKRYRWNRGVLAHVVAKWNLKADTSAAGVINSISKGILGS